MTKVSRLPLREDIWSRIFDLFLRTTIGIKDKKKLQAFINDLYSPTEKIMLSKRLACAVMLAKGNDYQAIKRTLRITDSTIAKMSVLVKYKNGGLRHVVEEIGKKDALRIIWEEISSLMDIPSKGKNWSSLGRQKYKREIKITELKGEF